MSLDSRLILFPCRLQRGTVLVIPASLGEKPHEKGSSLKEII